MASFDTISPMENNKNKQKSEAGPVQAYAKLEGDDFCYYIRTLQVTLGRKVKNPESVDIPLGNIKSVSRQHARLFYNFSEQRFEMMVFGKNGAFINERFVEKGVTVPLENRTKIQIGEVSFIFLLPRMDVEEAPQHENAGYISTPQQLEKKCRNKLIPPSLPPLPPLPPAILEEKPKKITIQLKLPKEDLNADDWVESSPDDHTGYDSKDIKPPFSYASLIAQAINSSRNKRLTLNGIYTYITTNYPYYQMASNGWQNSIRHNLSLNKAFVKVPRKDSEPGKGAFWTIDQAAETQFRKGVYKKGKRASSESKEGGASKRVRLDNEEEASDDEEEEDEEAVDCEDIDELEEDSAEDENEASSSCVAAQPVAATTEATANESDPEEEVLTDVKPEPASPTPGLGSTVVEPSPKLPSSSVSAEVPAKPAPTSTKKKIPNASLSSSILSAPSTPMIIETTSKKDAEIQLQLQLQNTIRQHLLDPIQHPLPPAIAQLLPQAIAQLPPQLAGQLSNTLQSALVKSRHNNKETSN